MASVRPYRAAVLVAGALVALGVWLGPRLLLGPEVPVTAVVQRDFVKSVVASGHVEAPHRVTIGAQIVGVVQRVPVAEGQSVSAGQTLVELERSEAFAAAAAAELAVTQAQARLRQLREVQAPVAEQTVRQARVNVDNARKQLLRQGDLFRQGFIGQAALDNAQRDVDLSEAQLRSAQSQWRSAESDGSDYAVASSALAQARAGAEAARSRLGYTTLIAPVAGTLIDRQVEPGDVVQPGKALMVLSPSGTTQVIVQIDEKNLQLLALGQRAWISADAYPEQRFAAIVAYINPGVDAQRGSVEVKLDVTEPPAYLRQDMTVSVDIEVASRAGAVLVPNDAVRDADTARPWVVMVADGRARRQYVRLGLRGTAVSEVTEGAGAGELVVASAQPDVADGSRVRALVAATKP
ncbi:MAG TPA: efflux RND transporter periplasmic adaptor subunit [Caldimonas sp.]